MFAHIFNQAIVTCVYVLDVDMGALCLFAQAVHASSVCAVCGDV